MDQLIGPADGHPGREVALEDPMALEEIDLYSELVIAASASDAPLTAAQIDSALGVEPNALADMADIAIPE